MRLRPLKSSSDLKPSTLPRLGLFYLIASIGIGISLIFWYAFIIQSNANLKHIVSLQTQHLAKDVNVQFELRISALKHLAKHLSSQFDPSIEKWKDESLTILNEYSGIESIAWVDPSLKVRQVFSNEKNESLNSRYYGLINDNRLRFVSTNKTMQVWLSAPYETVQHTKDIFVVLPITQGFLIGMINLNEVLKLELNNANYNVSVFYNKEHIFQFGPQQNPSIKAESTYLNLYGLTLKIVVMPSKELIAAVQTNLPLIALFLGVFIAILFAITTRLAYIARQRAVSLDQINLDLTREIAEREQAEESKHNLERALLQGQKLQAIGTLAGGIAHDFNNILYAIIGYVEMAQEDVSNDGLIYKNLSKVLEGAHRGQDLISRILTFSRRQVYEFKPIDLKETIEGVLSLIKPAIPASITLSFTAGIDNYIILGDQTQLYQVLMNIINNSVDAMDGEGEISITLSKALRGNPFFTQNPIAQDKDYYKFEIKDLGCGMDDETLERIFEPFFTTKDVGKGTGLGLATAHAIIKEHHGDIAVVSKLREGATFVIYLPTYKNIS